MNVTSAGWQVILCDPIWHVSSRSGEACCELLYSVYFTLLYFTHILTSWDTGVKNVREELLKNVKTWENNKTLEKRSLSVSVK